MLDQLGRDLTSLRAAHIPAIGWFRHVRTSLGISRRDVAEREGISQQAVAQFEASEAAGTIQLNKLASLADLLDCHLMYGLTPTDPIVIQRVAEVSKNRPINYENDQEPARPEFLQQSGVPRGGWLKAMRVLLGFSRREIADAMKLSKSTIADYEMTEATGQIRLNTLRKAAAGFGCEVVYFLANNPSFAPTFLNRFFPAPEAENKTVE